MTHELHLDSLYPYHGDDGTSPILTCCDGERASGVELSRIGEFAGFSSGNIKNSRADAIANASANAGDGLDTEAGAKRGAGARENNGDIACTLQDACAGVHRGVGLDEGATGRAGSRFVMLPTSVPWMGEGEIDAGHVPASDDARAVTQGEYNGEWKLSPLTIDLLELCGIRPNSGSKMKCPSPGCGRMFKLPSLYSHIRLFCRKFPSASSGMRENIVKLYSAINRDVGKNYYRRRRNLTLERKSITVRDDDNDDPDDDRDQNVMANDQVAACSPAKRNRLAGGAARSSAALTGSSSEKIPTRLLNFQDECFAKSVCDMDIADCVGRNASSSNTPDNGRVSWEGNNILKAKGEDGDATGNASLLMTCPAPKCRKTVPVKAYALHLYSSACQPQETLTEPEFVAAEMALHYSYNMRFGR